MKVLNVSRALTVLGKTPCPTIPIQINIQVTVSYWIPPPLVNNPLHDSGSVIVSLPSFFIVLICNWLFDLKWGRAPPPSPFPPSPTPPLLPHHTHWILVTSRSHFLKSSYKEETIQLNESFNTTHEWYQSFIKTNKTKKKQKKTLCLSGSSTSLECRCWNAILFFPHFERVNKRWPILWYESTISISWQF